jgi:hypothetical protein
VGGYGKCNIASVLLAVIVACHLVGMDRTKPPKPDSPQGAVTSKAQANAPSATLHQAADQARRRLARSVAVPVMPPGQELTHDIAAADL